MGGARFLAVLLLLPLLAYAAAAECDLNVNTCDTRYEGRANLAESYLLQHYNRHATAIFNADEHLAIRYPAAFAYFAEGSAANANKGNGALEKAFANPPTGSLDGAARLYLGWSFARFNGAGGTPLLSAENEARITAALNQAYVAGGESDAFAAAAGQYLFLDATGSGDASGLRAQLVTTLKTNGGTGWSSERNPGDLALIAEALGALFSDGDDPELQRLAEMNLDLLFARFAALNAAGAFGGVTAGDDLDASAFDPVASPWYGWSFLLLDTANTEQSFTAPGLLASGYCAHMASRAIYESRMNGGYETELLEEYARGSGKAYAWATDKLVWSGAVDVGDLFTDSAGFLTRASLRWTDDPYTYLSFSTRTSNESGGGPDGAADDGGRIYTSRNITMGKIGGDRCQEPHLFVGKGFELSHEPGTYALRNETNVVVLLHDGVYLAFQYLDGAAILPTNDRYAPLSQGIPAAYGDPARGTVLIPVNDVEGVFAMEAVPSSYVDSAPVVTGDLLIDLALAIANDTNISYDGNAVTYRTTLRRSAGDTYVYTLGTSVAVNGVIRAFGDYEPRRVRQRGYDFDFLRGAGSVWTVQGRFGTQGYLLTLDFAGATKSANDPASYACPATVDPIDPGDDDGAVGASPSDRLAFLAGSLVQDLAGEPYVLDCGPLDEVIPAAFAVDGAALAACVLEHDGERTVGFVYNEQHDAPPIATLLNGLQLFFPFNRGADPPDPTICDAIADGADGSYAFERCGRIPLDGSAYDPVSAYLNPDATLLVLSSDANPFTASFLDGFFDWLDGLFGGITEPGADPSETGSFDRAYLFQDGDGADGKQVRAYMVGDHAELLFDNMGSVLEPLRETLGGRGDHSAVGRTQRFSLDYLGAGEWRRATAAIRVASGGSPLTFPAAVCGNGLVEIGETCDPPGEVVAPCGDGSGNDITCDDGCVRDVAACSGAVCLDLDGDGYNVSSDGLAQCGPVDCDDTDPEAALIFDAAGTAVCPGLLPDSPLCDAPPTSGCPQCSNPGRGEACGDNANNNCDAQGLIDEGCPGSPGGTTGEDEGFICEGFDDGSGACPFVCNVTVVAGGGTTPPTTVSAYGLSCDDWNVAVEEPGVYTIREEYSQTAEGSFAAAGDRRIIFHSASTDPACYLFGHSSQWHIRTGANMHYFPDLTRYTDGAGHVVNVPWPYTIWSSTPGATDPWYNPPTGRILVKIQRTITGNQMTWRLAPTFTSPSNQELTRFLGCWYGDGWEAEFGATPTLAAVQSWAANLSAIGDIMVKPCEGEAMSGGTTGGGGSGGGGGLGGDSGCFTPRTPVTLADGSTKPIGEVAVGDALLVYDEENGAVTRDTITELLIHPGTWDMLLVNGELEVTRRHSILTARGWVRAEELTLGDRALAPDDWAEITAIEPFSYDDPVYNLHLSTHHNYFVNGMLVHNALIMKN